MRHIVVTGKRGAGKSTLVNRYLRKVSCSCSGFRTLPERMTEAGPVYVLQDIQTGRVQAISENKNGKICGIPETFEGFGVEVLRHAMASDTEILLMDEIGRFEQNCRCFLAELEKTFDCGKRIIAVLKKEELPHIVQIRERKDCLLLDLDHMRREDAWRYLMETEA